MNIHTFLTCDDLDELQRLYRMLSESDGNNVALIQTILEANEDRQAISNLLMYPLLMPSKDRGLRLIQTLCSDDNSYITLAAVVGLQDFDVSTISDEQQTKLVRCLNNLILGNNMTIAQRAAITLGNYVRESDLADLPIGEVMDPDIRHNIVVSVLIALGPAITVSWLRSVLNQKRIEFSISDQIQSILTELLQLSSGEDIDPFDLLMSSVGSHRLAYIPNLNEWNEQ